MSVAGTEKIELSYHIRDWSIKVSAHDKPMHHSLLVMTSALTSILRRRGRDGSAF